jgi:hypothetical protein
MIAVMHLKDDELITGLADHGDNEPLHAATYARVTTAASFAHWLTPIGNYFIARPAARSAAGKMTEQTGVPLDAAMVLGLSDTALHIWSADPMLNQVHDYLGHIPVERISAMHAEPGRSWQKLTITIEGGHALQLEARGSIHTLVADFDQRRRRT